MKPRGRAFASLLQDVVIATLVVSLVLVAQQWSIRVYQLGLLLLVFSAFTQIGVGNIPPTASFGQSVKLLALALTIIACVFALGIFLAPYLIKMARE